MTCNTASSRIIDEQFDHLCEEGEFREDDVGLQLTRSSVFHFI